uniref:Uncharacterized protein n=1 Tax=Globisporangium ultimum (strain ATCC 200006 / CBS 805.95 / DAOM BR144) TaxID=431595 RepID=K3WPV0_GLOUD
MVQDLTALPTALKQLQETVAYGSEAILSKLSVHDAIVASYEAGSVYPTLLGYALGAISTFCMCVTSNLVARVLTVSLSVLMYLQCLYDSDQTANAILLSFAALTGVGCTYVQVLSWQFAFAHVARKKKARKQARNK